jgi:hypothetical protein
LQPVVINEWMADNAGPNGLADPADDLFRTGLNCSTPTQTVSIFPVIISRTIFATDEVAHPGQTPSSGAQLPACLADNETHQNTGLSGSDLHAGFQLSGGGEAIGLFAPDGITAQSTVPFDQQVENVSQGFFPDGDTNVVFSMTNFTPRAANTLSGPLRVVRISFNAMTVTLTWSAIPGRIYRVEYKDDLSAPAWNSLGDPIEAVGSSAFANDTVSPVGHRFYRILRID